MHFVLRLRGGSPTDDELFDEVDDDDFAQLDDQPDALPPAYDDERGPPPRVRTPDIPTAPPYDRYLIDPPYLDLPVREPEPPAYPAVEPNVEIENPTPPARINPVVRPANDDIPWDQYINFLSRVYDDESQEALHPPSSYTLPVARAPAHGQNMQRTWLQEGLRNKFHFQPKPKLFRSSHLQQSDPLYHATKATLLQQVAAGKYEPCDAPLVSLPWFGVAKPDRTVRPIIDCRYINRFMKAPKISLPPLPRLMQHVPRKFTTALHYDISNGFDHIPRHPDSRPYFCINIDGQYYQSTRIMMGETCAPWAFQVWLNDMYNSFLKEHQFTFPVIKKQHIDDLLFLFPSTSCARIFGAKWEAWCADHGLLLSLNKSTRTPTSIIKHIGFSLDLQKKQATLTKARQLECLRLLSELRDFRGLLYPREWAKIVGLLGWARCGSPYVLALLSPGIEAAKDLSPPTSPSGLLDYDKLSAFFTANDPVPWSSSQTTMTITTDATFTRAGIIHPKGSVSLPVPREYQATIFLAELWAACSALVTHTRKAARVRLWIDNQPAMYALRKGRSRDPRARPLLLWVHEHLARLKAKVLPTYVRSCRNPADQLSRLAPSSRRLFRFPVAQQIVTSILTSLRSLHPQY
jgi:hypothetical protein